MAPWQEHGGTRRGGCDLSHSGGSTGPCGASWTRKPSASSSYMRDQIGVFGLALPRPGAARHGLARLFGRRPGGLRRLRRARRGGACGLLGLTQSILRFALLAARGRLLAARLRTLLVLVALSRSGRLLCSRLTISLGLGHLNSSSSECLRGTRC